MWESSQVYAWYYPIPTHPKLIRPLAQTSTHKPFKDGVGQNKPIMFFFLSSKIESSELITGKQITEMQFQICAAAFATRALTNGLVEGDWRVELPGKLVIAVIAWFLFWDLLIPEISQKVSFLVKKFWTWSWCRVSCDQQSHHLSKGLGAEYPWWFKPVRYITHVMMFGTIGAGACPSAIQSKSGAILLLT